jgi:hypothetical protein
MRRERRRATRSLEPSAKPLNRTETGRRSDSCRTACPPDSGTNKAAGKDSKHTRLTVEKHYWSEMFGYWG